MTTPSVWIGRPARPGRLRSPAWPAGRLFVCLGLGLALVLSGCGGDDEQEQEGGGPGGGPPGGGPPTLVRLATVQQQQVQQKRLVTGELQAVERSTVAAEEPGRVTQAPPDAGTAVEQDDVLVKLDTTLLQQERAVVEAQVKQARAAVKAAEAGVAEAQAQVAEAQAAVAEAQARVEQAASLRQRYEQLVETGGVPQTDYETAVRDEQVAQAQLETARALVASREAIVASRQSTVASERSAVDTAQASLQVYDQRLDKMTVHAPFDGVIVAKHTQRGQWLGRGSPVVDMQTTEKIDAVLETPEHLIGRIDRDTEVAVTITPLGVTREGPIHRIVPDADARTRTFPVYVRLDTRPAEGAGPELAPGMSVQAYLPTGRQTQALIVPRNAVQVTGDNAKVIARLDGSAVPMPVVLLFRHGDGFAVESQGLAPGMEVVVEGNERLFGGETLITPEEKQAQQGGGGPPPEPEGGGQA